MNKKENNTTGLRKKKEIGDRFKQFRNSIKRTQRHLAEELQVAQTTIASIERGKVFPRISYLNYLQDHYKLDFNWLFGKTGDIFLKRLEIEPWTKSLLPCHISGDDKEYAQYLELMKLMRMPEIETIILGKLVELKIFAKDEIKQFFDSQK
jgi:transcriptional regulator with XRE-family HTH domain